MTMQRASFGAAPQPRDRAGRFGSVPKADVSVRGLVDDTPASKVQPGQQIIHRGQALVVTEVDTSHWGLAIIHVDGREAPLDYLSESPVQVVEFVPVSEIEAAAS